MPFYEYECPSCRYYAEVMQKISDTPLKRCPSCGKAGFKRLISAPVFRLKGSGWYETDFKSDKEGKRNLAGGDEAEAKPAAESKPETKADAGAAAAATKSEPAADAKPSSQDKVADGASKSRPVKKSRRAGGATRATARHK